MATSRGKVNGWQSAGQREILTVPCGDPHCNYYKENGRVCITLLSCKSFKSCILSTTVLMRFNFLLRDSLGWTVLFFALVVLAVFTQLTKTTSLKGLPVLPRAVIKAAPALFLSGVSWYLGHPLVALAFVLCASGDVLLDIPEEKLSWGFEAGAISFAAALACFSVASYRNQLPGRPLWPLSITNIVIAIFILRWVLPHLKGSQRILEISYFGILIVANVFASTSTVPVFLGSSLWLMSDLSIGLSTNVPNTPASSLDTLGLYDLGLYFLAIGFLSL